MCQDVIYNKSKNNLNILFFITYEAYNLAIITTAIALLSQNINFINFIHIIYIFLSFSSILFDISKIPNSKIIHNIAPDY